MMESFAQNAQMLSIQFVPFVMAVVFHEYAHGLVAKQCGDLTAKEQGRLTLNPVPHIDPIGTLLFPIINMLSGMNILFGWARPVPIDPRRFKNYRKGLFLVALAGPGMNFFLAFLSAAVLCTISRFMNPEFYLFEPLLKMAFVSISLNYALGIFNLIPLPPLDGSKVVESFLSPQATIKFESISRYSFFILLGLLWVGAFSLLAYPIQICTGFTLFIMEQIFGIHGALL